MKIECFTSMLITNDVTAMPPEAKAKINLEVTNIQYQLDNEDTNEAIACKNTAIINGFLLPYLSPKVPNIVNPNNKPVMKEI